MTINPFSRVSGLRKPTLVTLFGLAVFVGFAVFTSTARADDKAKNAPAKIIPPALKAVDTAGKEVELAKLKGKVVLIDFWATWCTPCLKEIPNLKKIHEALHEKGFVIIGVANNDIAALKEHFEDQPMPWSTIADGENVISEDFKVDSWPTALLINAKGEQIATNLHAAKLLDKVIEELKLYPRSYRSLREEFEKAHQEKHSTKHGK